MPISLQTPAGIKHDNNSIDDPKHGYIYMDIYLDKREERTPDRCQLATGLAPQLGHGFSY